MQYMSMYHFFYPIKRNLLTAKHQITTQKYHFCFAFIHSKSNAIVSREHNTSFVESIFSSYTVNFILEIGYSSIEYMHKMPCILICGRHGPNTTKPLLFMNYFVELVYIETFDLLFFSLSHFFTYSKYRECVRTTCRSEYLLCCPC